MVAIPRTVLIVEDDEPLAHALDLKLKSAGHTTVVARSGQECLDLIGKQKFDVVLLDLILPVVDGFQVLAKVQQMPDKPIVFVLSNLSQAEDEQRVFDMGAKKFFIKSDTSLATIVDEVNNL
jgi:DNA-binding response OmpR family regulator